MFILIETLIYVIFFFYKLYSLIDGRYVFSTIGSKLRKYINNNLEDITCNLAFKQNNFLSKFLIIIRSSEFIKRNLCNLSITITTLIFKICITYQFISTNFFHIQIFNKNIDLVSFLSDYFILLKIIYYMSFAFLSFYISNYILKYLYNKKSQLNKNIPHDNSLSIYIGKDIQDKDVHIVENGLYQNILITGSIGSGKTSTAISNILDQFIKNQIYGLIIDVKGNYIEVVRELAKRNGALERVVEISLESNVAYNPLDKKELSSVELAGRMKQILVMLAKNNSSDSYWFDKAEEYIRDFITFIRAYNNVVNFYELHMLVISKEYLYEKIQCIKDKILNNEFAEHELFNINSAMSNIKNEYLKLDERTIGIIKSEITRITNVFLSDKKVFDMFCGEGESINFHSDKIYVFSIDIGKNKKIAKIVSAYLKQDFQGQVLSQNKPYKKNFFICDEYQEFASKDDSNFFGLSREYKCINVISMQSYSSLVNQVNDEGTSRVIMQNLVNKIWFRNDDLYTVEQIVKQIGKADIVKETTNYSESSQNSKYSMLSNRFIGYKSGLTKSISMAQQKENIIDEKNFTTNLRTYEATCMISDGIEMNLIKKVKMKRWYEDEEDNIK